MAAGELVEIMAITRPGPELQQVPGRAHSRPAGPSWPSPMAVGGGTGIHVRLNDTHILTDQRNWVSGLHGGGRWVCEGTSARDDFPAGLTETPGKEGTV